MLISKLAANIKTSILLAVFSVVGFLWSIFVVLPQIFVFNLEFKVIDLLIVFYVSLPIVFTVVSLVSIYNKKKISFVFWVSFTFWMLICGGELLEGKPYNPNFYSLIVIVIISIALASVKLISNKPHKV